MLTFVIFVVAKNGLFCGAWHAICLGALLIFSVDSTFEVHGVPVNLAGNQQEKNLISK